MLNDTHKGFDSTIVFYASSFFFLVSHPKILTNLRYTAYMSHPCNVQHSRLACLTHSDKAVNFSESRDGFQWPSRSSYLIPSKMPSCCCGRQLLWQQNKSQLSRESCMVGGGGWRILGLAFPQADDTSFSRSAWGCDKTLTDLRSKCTCCNFPYVYKEAIVLKWWSNER